MLLYWFFDSLLSTCRKKIETEKWPKAAVSLLHITTIISSVANEKKNLTHSDPFAIGGYQWQARIARDELRDRYPRTCVPVCVPWSANFSINFVTRRSVVFSTRLFPTMGLTVS